MDLIFLTPTNDTNPICPGIPIMKKIKLDKRSIDPSPYKD
jgi:hypothetical protein